MVAKGPVKRSFSWQLEAASARSHLGCRRRSNLAFTAFSAPAGKSLETRLARVDQLSRILDIAFVIPGTKVRFGVDAIIGLVPVIGDLAGVALSSIIVVEAARLGVPSRLLARMVGNVLIEGAVGAVPIAGDVFDVFWRANRRNVALLKQHFDVKKPR